MTNRECHLQSRRADWESATEQELVDALLDMPVLVCPFFMAWVRNERPQALRRGLLLHEQLGGYLGAPARKWLGRSR